jgi:hypothetical protein
MKPLLPRRRAVAEPPPRRSDLIYLPGGVQVLRAAVEELLRSSWKESSRRRACEIACAFERCFKTCGHPDLAVIAHSMRLLLEMSHAESAALGAELQDKLNELLRRLEDVLTSDDGRMTG